MIISQVSYRTNGPLVLIFAQNINCGYTFVYVNSLCCIYLYVYVVLIEDLREDWTCPTEPPL